MTNLLSMYAACCLRFLILLFCPLLTTPAALEAAANEILDFFLHDSGFGPLTFFCFGFFSATVDVSAFSRDSSTDFSYLFGCVFSTPIFTKQWYISYVGYHLPVQPDLVNYQTLLPVLECCG